MSKTILAILIGALLISGALYLTMPDDDLYFEVNENENEEEVILEENNNNEEDSDELGAIDNEETVDLIDCLRKEGIVIYGSKTCPACAQLASSFGGYDVIEKIYVECTEDYDRCGEEKKTGYVPEIQIKGDLYEEGRSPAQLAAAVGCEI